MRLTLHTDYSLRVLIHLATSDRPRSSIAEIAEAFQISRNHLMKVVHDLGRGGFINTMRGRGGGFSLARPAGEISIGDVVRFSETDMQMVDCDTCVIRGGCGLIAPMAEATNAFLGVLDRYTVADAVTDKNRLRRALFPETAN